MKTVGVIGGLSYESTAQYYLDINKSAIKKLGGYNKLEIVIITVNLDEIIAHANNKDWEKVTLIFTEAAFKLQSLGADFIVIPCNSFHIVADDVQKAISVPLLSIIDCVGDYISKLNYSKVALLGSNFTMENNFFINKLFNKYGVLAEVPDKPERDKIHNIIVNELCHGIFLDVSREYVKFLCEKLMTEQGCQAIILGCTELPMLLSQSDTHAVLVATTDIHASYIANRAVM